MKRSGTQRPKNKSLGDKGLGVQDLHHVSAFFFGTSKKWGLPKQQRQQIQPHIRKDASFTSDDDIKGRNLSGLMFVFRFYFSRKKPNIHRRNDTLKGLQQLYLKHVTFSYLFILHTNITSLVSKHHSKSTWHVAPPCRGFFAAPESHKHLHAMAPQHRFG